MTSKNITVRKQMIKDKGTRKLSTEVAYIMISILHVHTMLSSHCNALNSTTLSNRHLVDMI